MTENPLAQPSAEEAKPRWQPLSAIDRRVIGVLAEKAKTTPDSYPMSLNAICTGSNQKSNRAPVMQLEPDDIEESLDRLRQAGAIGMIEGYGRVSKYRHYLYEWLGVDKVELAVVAELLLRGAQTEGELRGRASRMEPIADLTALRPVLDRLKAKELVIPLTPTGRGHVVTHALYQPRELERVKAQYGRSGAEAPAESTPPRSVASQAAPSEKEPSMPADRAAAPSPPSAAGPPEAARRELEELRSQVTQLREELDEVRLRQDHAESELRELKDALGV